MGQSFDLLPTDTSLDAKEGIMLQVFSILTSATVEVKHRKMREFIRKGPSELTPGRDVLFTHLCSEMVSKRLPLADNKVDKALQKLLKSMQGMSAQRGFRNLHHGTPTLVGEPRTLF